MVVRRLASAGSSTRAGVPLASECYRRRVPRCAKRTATGSRGGDCRCSSNGAVAGSAAPGSEAVMRGTPRRCGSSASSGCGFDAPRANQSPSSPRATISVGHSETSVERPITRHASALTVACVKNDRGARFRRDGRGRDREVDRTRMAVAVAALWSRRSASAARTRRQRLSQRRVGHCRSPSNASAG